LSTESTFQRCIDYVDIIGHSYSVSEGRFSEWRLIYQGCRALTFALARLSCLYLEPARRNYEAVVSCRLYPFFFSSSISHANPAMGLERAVQAIPTDPGEEMRHNGY